MYKSLPYIMTRTFADSPTASVFCKGSRVGILRCVFVLSGGTSESRQAVVAPSCHLRFTLHTARQPARPHNVYTKLTHKFGILYD